MSSEPIADYALLSDCAPARWSVRPAPWTGSASRASTAPRCSDGSWARRPDTGRSGPLGAHSSTRRYVGPTMVLETTHTTAAGSVTVTDALALGRRPARPRPRGGLPGHPAAPGVLHAGHRRRRHRPQRPARLRPRPAAAQLRDADGGILIRARRYGPVVLDAGGVPARHRHRPGRRHRHGARTPDAFAPETLPASPSTPGPATRGGEQRPGVLEPGRDRPPARGHRAGLDQLVRDAPELPRAVAGARRPAADGSCRP